MSILQVQHIEKHFGDTRVLEDISFELEQGQALAIIGSSGSGYRGGIQGVPKGQQEAGQVLGMTKSQIFFKVTLLQVVKRIVPPMGNEFITLVKDTSLVRVISVYEIIWVGESFIKKGMIWPLFYCMVFYLLFSGALTLALGWFERKLSYFK